MTISDSQARSLLMGLEAGKNPLSKSEIRKLTDYDSLKDLSQNEVKQKSIELERTLKKFKKMQEDIMGGKKPEEMAEDYDDDYDYDDEYGSEQPSSINFFSLIPKGFFGISGGQKKLKYIGLVLLLFGHNNSEGRVMIFD